MRARDLSAANGRGTMEELSRGEIVVARRPTVLHPAISRQTTCAGGQPGSFPAAAASRDALERYRIVLYWNGQGV